MEQNDCRLCAYLAKGAPSNVLDGVMGDLLVDCSICGHAAISEDARDAIDDERVSREALRGYIRNKGSAKKPIRIEAKDVPEIVREGESRLEVLDKLEHFLLLVAARSKQGGEAVGFSLSSDYPLVYARSAKEMGWMLRELRDESLIVSETATAKPYARLNTKGWERVAALRAASGAGRRCFVAMAFGDEYRATWEAIARAIALVGFEPHRVDLKPHSELIPMKILADIRRSRFVVADITGHRNGVYFEAGFGMGLGRPVIWACRRNNLRRAHFDVKQYGMILYNDPPDLAEKLEDSIRAQIT